MSLSSKGIYIVAAKRTPFCNYGGNLRELPASYAFAAAAKDAMHSGKVDPLLVDQTIVGNINYLSQCDGGKTPRYCGIYSGVPIEKPALGVSKACGSGLQAIITGATDILFGTSKLCLTGGTEIMSSLPMLVRNVRFGTALGSPYIFEDHIKTDLVDSVSGQSLTKIADETAKRWKIQREEVDDFVLSSHLKWKNAFDRNDLKDEITTLTTTLNKKEVVVDNDQLTFASMSSEQLSQLATIHDDGVVTAGNSSAPADGAAALVLAEEQAIKVQDLEPLTRVAGWASVGVDLADTGIAAATAMRKLIKLHQLKVEDIDLFEINETYASQVLAVIKELQIDEDTVNVNGGALVLGHPVSATGARMATSLVYEMRRRNAKRAIAASSCGGGQGIAVLFESL